MTEQPGWPLPIVPDPDLNPDVFWIVDEDGTPLGVGLLPPSPDRSSNQ